MKVEISVPEVVSIFKEIQQQPENIFEMIRVEIKESVGQYLSKMMELERTQFLGRQWYEHAQGDVNHRNGSYSRNFTLKGIGSVKVEVPRDRKGEFETQVIPRSKQYEVELRQDLSLMFLTGISTRSLSMMSERLIGRKVSPTEVSNANKELIEAVEKWRTRDLSGEPIKYIFLDGVNFDMRIDRSIEKAPKDADAPLGAVGFRQAAFNVSVMAVWNDPALDVEQINWARESAAAVEPWSFSGGGYVNYMQADEPIERVRAAFGAETFNRLQMLKRQYDPHNILRRNQNIPPR